MAVARLRGNVAVELRCSHPTSHHTLPSLQELVAGSLAKIGESRGKGGCPMSMFWAFMFGGEPTGTKKLVEVPRNKGTSVDSVNQKQTAPCVVLPPLLYQNRA